MLNPVIDPYLPPPLHLHPTSYFPIMEIYCIIVQGNLGKPQKNNGLFLVARPWLKGPSTELKRNLGLKHCKKS